MATADSPNKTRQQLVLDTLRREIVSGVFPPGARLPVQSELMARFGVGCSTASYALACLTREGFVVARRGAGCVVRNDPPHLRNIVVAVPQRPTQGRHWSNYFVAMTRVVAQLRAETHRPIHTVEGFEDERDAGRIELEQLTRLHGAAGIIFVTHPYMLDGSPILTEPGIPRLAVVSSESPVAGIDTRVTMGGGFFEKALDCLLTRGRRRIAVLTAASRAFTEYDERIRAAVLASGAICPPHWQIPINIGTPLTAQSVTRLLMQAGDAHGRPDGLIVADDNLVEDAVAGVIAEGIRIPEDLEIVAHCNFPWPPFKAVPLRRLGPDIGRLLRECIAVIDARRAGQAAPALIEAPAVWEAECQSVGIEEDQAGDRAGTGIEEGRP